MVNSESSGVAFSRHPLKPITSNSVFVEAVYGLGEGLVSGEFEADRYEVIFNLFDTFPDIINWGPIIFCQG